MTVSKRLAVTLLLVALAVVALESYHASTLTLFCAVLSPSGLPTILADLNNSTDPNLLLVEANRLAWLFNWPKASHSTNEQKNFSKKRATTRNEVYARIGRIRAQSETMSYVDVSQMIDEEIARPSDEV